MQLSEYELGKKLFAFIKAKKSGFNPFKLDWYKNFLLSLSLKNPELQTQMFRFVDVLPSLKSQEEINRYLVEYLNQANSSLAELASFTSSLPFTGNLSEQVINFSVETMAKTFIGGSNISEAQKKINSLEKKKQKFTLDILGELVVSSSEAEEYYNTYLELIEKIPNLSISIKLSALCPQIHELDFDYKKSILKPRLETIYRAAMAKGAQINVDTEHYAWKDFTFDLLKEVLMQDEFKNWNSAGIVVQAYLKDSRKDLTDWISWAKQRETPIKIRLVKGAYWDYEHAHAMQKNWQCPVFENKPETDINYEECTEILLENYQYVYPAIASHNVRSLVHSIVYSERYNIPREKYEIQMLYGMLDELKDYFSDEGFNLRVYLPYGELIPGMSYLVRRLLENTANDSFLRQGFMDGRSEDELLVDPRDSLRHKEWTPEPEAGIVGFVNAADIDYSKSQNRDRQLEAIERLEAELDSETLYPIFYGEKESHNDNCFESVNPAKPKQILGQFSHATIEDCDKAIVAAQLAFSAWNKISPADRSSVLKQAAYELEARRMEFTSILVLESGKPWHDSDAEVSEAIDFLNYYALNAEEMFTTNKLASFPGERNTNLYQPYGVSLVISPWNFPLAIMTGMTVASLVCGNAVIVKPSSQTCLVAYKMLELLRGCLPREFKPLVSFMPGEGRVIGDYLTRHDDIRLIAFTGSNATGMRINDICQAARPTKKFIAEMGGKNAIIVDESADLDEAIPGVIYSAFGYAGQKCSACSRLILVDAVYDHFIARFTEAMKEVQVGDPRDINTYMGPQIDLNAQMSIEKYIKIGHEEAKALIDNIEIPKDGYFISPTVFVDVDENSTIAQEEIFGPVLAVIRAKDLDDAIRVANNSAYGLTGALYSRSPENINKTIREFNTGNLYINRSSTGAVVSRQAFGGMKNSSIGFKAGGPNYLLQFVLEKTITENTMRRGFVE